MIWSHGINTFTHAGTRRSDAGFTGCGVCFAGGRGITVDFDAQASDATNTAINWTRNDNRRDGGLGPG